MTHPDASIGCNMYPIEIILSLELQRRRIAIRLSNWFKTRVGGRRMPHRHQDHASGGPLEIVRAEHVLPQ